VLTSGYYCTTWPVVEAATGPTSLLIRTLSLARQVFLAAAAWWRGFSRRPNNRRSDAPTIPAVSSDAAVRPFQLLEDNERHRWAETQTNRGGGGGGGNESAAAGARSARYVPERSDPRIWTRNRSTRPTDGLSHQQQQCRTSARHCPGKVWSKHSASSESPQLNILAAQMHVKTDVTRQMRRLTASSRYCYHFLVQARIGAGC